jgi:hypothetical protein
MYRLNQLLRRHSPVSHLKVTPTMRNIVKKRMNHKEKKLTENHFLYDITAKIG